MLDVVNNYFTILQIADSIYILALLIICIGFGVLLLVYIIQQIKSLKGVEKVNGKRKLYKKVK